MLPPLAEMLRVLVSVNGEFRGPKGQKIRISLVKPTQIRRAVDKIIKEQNCL